MQNMITLDQKLITAVSQKAQESTRLRANFNIHQQFDDPINRFFNAIEPGSYVQPHKHENPDKREMFIVMSGKLLVIAFDDNGNPIQPIVLTDTFYEKYTTAGHYPIKPR